MVANINPHMCKWLYISSKSRLLGKFQAYRVLVEISVISWMFCITTQGSCRSTQSCRLLECTSLFENSDILVLLDTRPVPLRVCLGRFEPSSRNGCLCPSFARVRAVFGLLSFSSSQNGKCWGFYILVNFLYHGVAFTFNSIPEVRIIYIYRGNEISW